jgi:imidazolonepropionase
LDTGAILIRGARQLLTLHGAQGPRRGNDLNELGIIHDGALLVRDGVVQQVGTTRRVENLAEARDAIEISAAGRVVMPGFIDSHTHLLWPSPDATEDEFRAAASMVRTSSAKRVAGRARKHLEAMARHGTTTVEVKVGGPAGNPDADDAVEVKLLRVLAALDRDPLDLIPTLLLRLPQIDGEAARREAVERICSNLLPKICRRRLARFADMEVNRDEESVPLFERFVAAAGQAGMAMKIHRAWGSAAQAVELANGNPVASLDHAEQTPPEEANALGSFAGVTTLLPENAFGGGELHARARSLVDAGAAIALASNFHPQRSPMLSLQAVIAMVCTPPGLTVAEAISAVTINGAHAAGRGARAGSLEVGKAADLLMLNTGDYRELPEHFGTNLVHLTMKRGAFIYKEGAVGAIDVENLKPRW